MIVYGDPDDEAPAGALLARLRTRVATTVPSDLDALPALLIEAVQREQVARDGLPDRAATERALKNVVGVVMAR